MGKSNRNYGLDLLRILLAVMVILIHINANGTGQVLKYATIAPWNWLVTIITMLCYPAVNTYILITGFYSYNNHNSIRTVVKSLSSLWLLVTFYSILGYLVIVFGFHENFSAFEFVGRFFPITRGVWWFYTVYFALILLSPFLNRLLDALSNDENRLLLFLLVVMLCVLPVFVDWNGQLGSNYGYSLIWFLVLYITGALIGKFNLLKHKNRQLLDGCLFYILFSIILCVYPKLLSFIGIQSTVAMYNSLFCYLQSIALFFIFANLNVNKKIQQPIAAISKLSLASYLLHCQEDIENKLWSSLSLSDYANSSKIIIVASITVISILFVALLLEYLRCLAFKVLQIDCRFRNFTNRIFLWIEKHLKLKEV